MSRRAKIAVGVVVVLVVVAVVVWVVVGSRSSGGTLTARTSGSAGRVNEITITDPFIITA